MAEEIKNFEISLQTRIFYGNKVIDKIENYLDSIEAKKVMLVCGRNFKSSSSFSKLHDALKEKLVGVYDQVKSHPTFDTFYKGGEMAREIGADTILSAGGGSSIDSGKGIALLRDESVNLKEFLVGYDETKGRIVKEYRQEPFKHVTVPTTFSSAETNGSAAVVDPSTKRKYILWSDASLPSAAFLDPELTETLPSEVTATSGMNTLAHCVETLYSVDIQPVSRSLALGALELISKNIQESVKGPDTINARGRMLIASSMAGYAYGNAVVSIHHAICHVLGSYFDIPHGVANSVMLPYVMTFMRKHLPDKIAETSYYLGISERTESTEKASLEAIEWVNRLRESLKVPTRLSELGISKSDLESIANWTMDDWVAFQSLRKIRGKEEIMEILSSAL